MPLRVDADDITGLYELLLGRLPESDAVLDLYIDGDMAGVIDQLTQSLEYRDGPRRQFALGLVPRGGLYGAPPSDAFRQWAATRLPLNDDARAALDGGRSWGDLLTTVFSDTVFRNSFPRLDKALCQDGFVPDPLTDVVAEDDNAHSYQFFLGRAPETPSVGQRLIGILRQNAIRGFLGSIEFIRNVQDPLLDGEPPIGSHFTAAPSADTLAWASARLPISRAARAGLLAAVSWTEAFGTVFADPQFIALFGDHQKARAGSAYSDKRRRAESPSHLAGSGSTCLRGRSPARGGDCDRHVRHARVGRRQQHDPRRFLNGVRERAAHV